MKSSEKAFGIVVARVYTSESAIPADTEFPCFYSRPELPLSIPGNVRFYTCYACDDYLAFHSSPLPILPLVHSVVCYVSRISTICSSKFYEARVGIMLNYVDQIVYISYLSHEFEIPFTDVLDVVRLPLYASLFLRSCEDNSESCD